MRAATRVLASAAVGSLVVVCTPALAATGPAAGTGTPSPSTQTTIVESGSISGTVQDEQGKPLAGVVVSALGARATVAVTATDGRFEFRALPPGPYLVRAHMVGYVAGRAQSIQVAASGRAVSTILLRRSSGTILNASLGADADPEPDSQPQSAPGDATIDAIGDATDLVWHLRHARRSVLKDTSVPTELLIDGDEEAVEGAEPFGGADVLGRSIGTPSRGASAFFGDIPFSGQVNLLTAGSFNSPQQLLSNDTAARGIAYARLGAPVGDRGDWMVRGAVTQADISSWSVAGSYATRPNATHRYNVGMAYSTQRYDGGNVLALREVSDGSRNAGAVYGYDTFPVSPIAALTVGVAYARYDYLDSRGVVSPRVDLSVVPAAGLRLNASLSRTALAPGAEEFAPPSDSGVWLPPQRTFSSIETGRPFTAERTTNASLAMEKDIRRSVVGLKVFRQQVDDQLATVFGVNVPGAPPAAVGHYFVGNAGNASASGYSGSLKTEVTRRVHCAFEYTSALAQLSPAENLHYLLVLAPSTLRPTREHIHDLSTSVETEVPETATRVLVLYRISDGFARAGNGDESAIHPRVDGRFDVQIRQSLPFMSFTSAQWEMLLAVRNFFRQDGTEQSVYDELLVVNPPKRVLGGVTVRF
jgi:hypothetical protein